MSNIGWNKSKYTTFSFVVKRKKSGRPWYWTLGIHLWWKKFGLFSIFIWWKRSDVSCSVLLPRGFGSLSLWTYQRTNKSKRPQSVGPKRFFCPGCWAAAWTSTTSSSGPTYSRTSSSGTSSRSCTERDCLLSPTNGMNHSHSINILELSYDELLKGCYEFVLSNLNEWQTIFDNIDHKQKKRSNLRIGQR